MSNQGAAVSHPESKYDHDRVLNTYWQGYRRPSFATNVRGGVVGAVALSAGGHMLLGGGGFLLRGGAGGTGRDGAADQAADQSANTDAVVIALSVTARAAYWPAAPTTRQRLSLIPGATCPCGKMKTASTRLPLPSLRTTTRNVCGRPDPVVSC